MMQNTFVAIGYCPPFYFDPRSARGFGSMMFQSFIGQMPVNGACNQAYNNNV